eukprot:12899565-Prorocentrum_lima.AAC.1
MWKAGHAWFLAFTVDSFLRLSIEAVDVLSRMAQLAAASLGGRSSLSPRWHDKLSCMLVTVAGCQNVEASLF